MAEYDAHQMMTCPYNPAHQVEHYRLHVHLQKCRKQYPNAKKATCPFDATHIVNEVELDYHVGTCPKRLMLDQQKYVMDDDCKPVIQVEPLPVMHSEENWDDDNVTSYKPEDAKIGNHIIKKVKGATPSERRKARMEGIKTYRPKDEQ